MWRWEKKNLVTKKKNGMFVGKKRAVLFFIFFSRRKSCIST